METTVLKEVVLVVVLPELLVQKVLLLEVMLHLENKETLVVSMAARWES